MKRFLIISFLAIAMLYIVFAYFKPTKAGYALDVIASNSQDMPPLAMEALQNAVAEYTGQPPKNHVFQLTALMWHDSWGIAKLSMEPIHEVHDLSAIRSVLLVEINGKWEASFDDQPYTQQLLVHIPDEELSAQEKVNLFPKSTVLLTTQQHFNYKFPWHSGEIWTMTGSRGGVWWHGDKYSPAPIPLNHALDFDIVGSVNTDVLASASGVAVIDCIDNAQALIVVTTDGTNNEKTGYLHLDVNTIGSPNSYPRYVSQGDVLGQMKEVNDGAEFESPCGVIYGTHLHFYAPTKPFVMDGETFDNGNLPAGKRLFSSQEVSENPNHSDYPFPPEGHFPDVPSSNIFFSYIETLYHIGAIRGYSDGNFYPNEDITRGAISKIIILAMGEEYREDEPLPSPFSDVPSSHVFYPYIMRMKDLGITSGYSDGTFRPEEPLTRSALAKFLTIAHDGEEPFYNDCVQPFPDVSCDNVFYPYIRRLKEIFDEEGVSLGYSDNTFRPDENITRSGASKLSVVALGWVPLFPDVPYYHTFFKYIQGIGQREITSGYSDGTFRPEETTSRGAVAKFIVRGLGFEPTANDYPIPTFPDVPSTHVFYADIEFLAEYGVINGYSDGTFRPDEALTRGAIAKMIVRALDNVWNIRCSYNQDPSFTDVSVNHIFYQDIQCLKELEITDGFSDGTFRPDSEITRGATAKFIYIGFVQLAPYIPQELMDGVNNLRETAPSYKPWDRFILPATDEDWIRYDISSSALAQDVVTGYLISVRNTGANILPEICIYDSVGNQHSCHIGRGDTQIFWSPQTSGTYYFRLTNSNVSAVDGVHMFLVVEEVTFTDTIYLPLIQR